MVLIAGWIYQDNLWKGEEVQRVLLGSLHSAVKYYRVAKRVRNAWIDCVYVLNGVRGSVYVVVRVP